jgi:hypothetical protein
MASKTNPRRTVALVVLLVALAVVAVVQLRPSLLPGGGDAAIPKVGTYKVPKLGLQGGERELPDVDQAGRNLFAFGAPPTPTPDRRPTPTPPPTRPPVPRTPPPPTPCPYIEESTGKCLPKPPNFTMTYMGWLGPDRLPVAVFKNGEEIVVAALGETIQGKFILRKVDAQGVTIGFVGYPETATTPVSLAR